MALKKILYFVTVALLVYLPTGCQYSNTGSDTDFFVVEFTKKQPLRYKMVSERNVVVDFDPKNEITKGRAKKNSKWNIQEKLEIIAEIQLKRVDSIGLMEIEISYPLVKVTRKGQGRARGHDAVENLNGKSATVKITPAGFITNAENLKKLIQSLGEKAFSKHSSGLIKDQDMVADFYALQWFMFNPVSSIKEPLDGVKPGQSWEDTQPLPSPVLLNTARKTSYQLTEIAEEKGGKKAKISSSYSLAKIPKDFVKLYSGKTYRQRGFFGVLKCKPVSITGSGFAVFDMNKGILEKNIQQYQLTSSAMLFMPLPGTENSIMTIDQKLSIELID